MYCIYSRYITASSYKTLIWPVLFSQRRWVAHYSLVNSQSGVDSRFHYLLQTQNLKFTTLKMIRSYSKSLGIFCSHELEFLYRFHFKMNIFFSTVNIQFDYNSYQILYFHLPLATRAGNHEFPRQEQVLNLAQVKQILLVAGNYCFPYEWEDLLNEPSYTIINCKELWRLSWPNDRMYKTALFDFYYYCQKDRFEYMEM